LLAAVPAACKPKGHDVPPPAADTAPAKSTDTSDQLAQRQITAPAGAPIAVSSTAFSEGAAIPDRYSAYGRGMSPPVSWAPVAGAKSYALIVEDPNAPMAKPFVHWLAWNLPPETTRLAEDLNAAPKPHGLAEGKNGSGTHGYFGPKPPAGAPHHYHFQVFALDTDKLDVKDGADRDALVGAMKGHVIAEGEIVGTYQAKPAT
jgi:Raf kinase inhibitor-like YbhB/YbcL family protein